MKKFIQTISEELFQARGLDISEYRQNILEKRMWQRMEKLGIYDPSEYLELLHAHPAEYDQLIETIVVKVSSFFRNPVVFEIIAQTILPEIIESRKREGVHQIRIWSAGCASGEEPYSIAILLCEALKNEIDNWQCYIFGTDISNDALNIASAGIYSHDSLKDTKLGILDKYFVVGKDTYEIQDVIKKMVRFSRDDVTSKNRFAPADSIFGTFDMIFCRNVMIYFSRKLQQQVLGKFYKALCKGGFLVIGDTESLTPNIERKLIMRDRRNRIFQKSLGG